MLFKRIFSWIKHKVLTPTTLANNRLFVERDTKRRRIFTNFGVTFRNSKWGSYFLNNIKIKLKTMFYRFLSWIIAFVILMFFVWNFGAYYVYTYAFNTVFGVLWTCWDSLTYLSLFALWGLATLGSACINWIYQSSFIAYFTAGLKNEEPAAIIKLNVTDESRNLISFDKKNTTKYELTQTMTNWLMKRNNKAFEELTASAFSHKIDSIWWKKNYNLFARMSRSMLSLDLANLRQNKYLADQKLLNNGFKFINTSNFAAVSQITNSALFNKFSHLFFTTDSDDRKTSILPVINVSDCLNYLDNSNRFNLLKLTSELNKYPFLIKTKTGLFFFHEFDYQKLSYLTHTYSEFTNLTNFIQNQILSAKWNRWLYRYSMLHRKVLKNSHKLTLTKRLLNAGIFDKKFVQLNTTNGLFNNFFNMYYPNLSNQINTLNFFNINDTNNYTIPQINNLELLSYYEYSYFWFLKRFYLFNTLPNNFIKSSPQLIKDQNSELTVEKALQNSKYRHYSMINGALLKSLKLNLSSFVYFYNFNTTSDLIDFIKLDQSRTILKSTYLTLQENDLFSTNMSKTLVRVTDPFVINKSVGFFNYCNISTFLNTTSPISTNIVNAGVTNEVFTKINAVWYLSIDNCYSTDISVLVDLYK